MMDAVFGIALLVIGFVIGARIVQRTTSYRIGRKILEDMESILERRTFVGPKEIKVGTTRKWQHGGHDWELKVSQDAQSSSSLGNRQ